jgi:hypothetical protein
VLLGLRIFLGLLALGEEGQKCLHDKKVILLESAP